MTTGASDEPGNGRQGDSADSPDAFGRPEGVNEGFAPRQGLPPPGPVARAADPGAEAAFGRPAHEQNGFAEGPRLGPRRAAAPTVTPALHQAFGRPAAAGDFAPAPGDRIEPRHGTAPPTWWKGNDDAWRDPDSPYWLVSRRAPRAVDDVDDDDDASGNARRRSRRGTGRGLTIRAALLMV
ncbi:MAG: Serine protease, subfamily, contains C-terminal domain, partial [Pseudonocardiales bacterium]|nr:Serine protease, subfamily, contains C-terminal domain [Pseudonocardiales bacterium]